MDHPNLATAAHIAILSYVSSSRILPRYALPHITLPASFYHASSRIQAGGPTRNSKMVNLGGHLSDPGGIFSVKQKVALQITATVCASFSVTACLMMLYMSWMAKKNFRRNLIFLLLMGDFFKSTWYLLFASRSLAVGGIVTSSKFCQANGFLLQASIEACDLAILLMSVHMSLQIFSPTSRTFGHDGLYRFRHSVFVIYSILPLLSAGLAFVNSSEGYISQGPFCTLPIRPFWYRLALQWIPRYLVLAYIMFVALRIYIHVGGGLKVFARQQDRVSTGEFPSDGGAQSELNTTNNVIPPPDVAFSGQTLVPPERTDLTFGEVERRRSSINWRPAFPAPAVTDGHAPTAWNQSRRSSRIPSEGHGPFHLDLLQVPEEQRESERSLSTVSSFKSTGDTKSHEDTTEDSTRPATLQPIEEARAAHLEEGPDAMSADTPLKKRRRAIQRQLRLLFIYPSVYMIMWAVPFVYHAMNYSNYYAQHPVFGLAAVSVASTTFLGFVDCVVFGWREKPWRHIPGSDGTFLGAFMFWRFGDNALRHQWSAPAPSRVPNGEDSVIQTGKDESRPRGFLRSSSYNSIRPMMHRKTFSASSDRTALEAERAAQRLALERAERGGSTVAHTRNGSVNTNNKPTEWWDRRLSDTVHDTPREERENRFDSK